MDRTDESKIKKRGQSYPDGAQDIKDLEGPALAEHLIGEIIGSYQAEIIDYSQYDPNGSWTGVPSHTDERPVQDVDDL